MKDIDQDQAQRSGYAIKTRPEFLNDTESALLKWVEVIIACVLISVLVYLAFLRPEDTQNVRGYQILVSVEFLIVFMAIGLNMKGHFILSSALFILAAVIGPWWAAFMDPAVFHGNLFPLVYSAIAILFSGYFSPVYINVIVGIIQITGLGLFIYISDFNLHTGASSLFFFVLFIFAFSLIINMQNRNNRKIIADQVKELQEMAMRDPLTGLNNRRFLFEFLEKEIARLKRQDNVLSLLILDIDDFKNINDTCGHQTGDKILLAVTESLRAHFRESDILSRYGGDEFLVLMSGSSVVDARKRTQKLQSMISERSFADACEAAQKVTVSVGIASFPEHGEAAETIIKTADDALYRAKARGKNRIEMA